MLYNCQKFAHLCVYTSSCLSVLLFQCLWSIVAAILHLGNLEFKGNGQTQASFQDLEQARTVAKVTHIIHVNYASGLCTKEYNNLESCCEHLLAETECLVCKLKPVNPKVCV